jgi:peptidoglycan hydrolase-like protein with peptidoglycan-binding domain
VSGAKARLQNLGYYRGPVDGVFGPSLHIALALFQADHDLEAQGELDDETIAKLIEVHGF